MKRRNSSLINSMASKERKGQRYQQSYLSADYRKRGGVVATTTTLSLEEQLLVHDDRWNYALLLVLYTLQGIPMGLSASIPFLIQQKIKTMAEDVSGGGSATANLLHGESAAIAAAAVASRLSYHANAIFALSSWPFSLKLLWAPIVDAVYVPAWGRRKSWLLPVQLCAGLVMMVGANFVERQLSLAAPVGVSTHQRNALAAATQIVGMDSNLLSSIDAPLSSGMSLNVAGVTSFFFLLYFLMATQDISVDGWALTMLSKINRGRGPICNSIGQNIGYFFSFTGFLAFNDAETAETLWRPLFGWPSQPGVGLITLGGFIRAMGLFILVTTILVACLKREVEPSNVSLSSSFPEDEPMLVVKPNHINSAGVDNNNDQLDDSNIGCVETYHRLWAVCKLPAVQLLFFLLLTYRLPTSLSDNVKFLKAVEWGLPKSTTALLSPTLILPLGIITPIVANRIWHGHPLRQFMIAYVARVTLVPFLDLMMLRVVRHRYLPSLKSTMPSIASFWFFVIASTAAQAIVQSLQFNAQMTFFASRADPAIGGSYMTLLNTAANMGGTWPSSVVMWLLSRLTKLCQQSNTEVGATKWWCSIGGIHDPYFVLQILFAGLGCLWILCFGKLVQRVASLPDEAWRAHFQDSATTTSHLQLSDDIEAGTRDSNALTVALLRSTSKRE